jgi:hypothetical protein
LNLVWDIRQKLASGTMQLPQKRILDLEYSLKLADQEKTVGAHPKEVGLVGPSKLQAGNHGAVLSHVVGCGADRFAE